MRLHITYSIVDHLRNCTIKMVYNDKKRSCSQFVHGFYYMFVCFVFAMSRI